MPGWGQGVRCLVWGILYQLRPLIGAVYLKRGVFLFIQFRSLLPASSQLK